MPFSSYLSCLGYICASYETKITSLRDPGTQGFADFFSELQCSSHLPTSCHPGMYQLFHSSAAAILCSKTTCGLSLWRCSWAQKSVCDGSWLCLPALCLLSVGRLLSESETSFHFFTFGHLGRLAFELVAQTAFFFFFLLLVILQAELVFAFVRENMDSIA